MTIRPTYKRGLHWAGSALALVGIAFVVLRFRDYGVQINFARFDVAIWVLVFVFAFIYGFSNLLLSFAWLNLLVHFGAKTSRRWAVKAYGVSQLAKYVPGNIFHLAGRQAIGMAAGVPGWALAKTSVWELGLISVAGGIFGFLVLPLLFPALPVAAGLSGFIVVVAITFIVLWRYIGHQIGCALGWYVGFLSISGLLFYGLVDLVSVSYGMDGTSWIPLGGAYVIAWVVGLITPGAPAGLGVRELVLLFLLKGTVGEGDLVFAVALGRLVTVGGDLASFAFASVLKSGMKTYDEI